MSTKNSHTVQDMKLLKLGKGDPIELQAQIKLHSDGLRILPKFDKEFKAEIHANDRNLIRLNLN
jgi:hypothetical protein